MPVSDVLRGFIGETAKFADDQRQQQRQREDAEIGDQQALIRAYMEHPNVNPAMLGKMMEDYMALGKAKAGPRKGKGGGAGFMGASETPISHIIQGLHSGEFMPSGDPDQPAGMTHGQPQTGAGGAQPDASGGPPPPLGPASGKVGGGVPAPAAAAAPAAGGGVPPPPVAGSPIMPDMQGAAAGIPAPPPAAAPGPAPATTGSTSTPLLLNTEAMARRAEVGASATAYGKKSGDLRAIMDQIKQLRASGMPEGDIELWRKKEMGIPIEHFSLKPMVRASDPAQQTVWVNYGSMSGSMHDPDTKAPVTGMIPDPKYQHVTSYDAAGNLMETYVPVKPGGLAATGGVLPQVSGSGAEGKPTFQPVTPAVSTGPGGTTTTTLVPHAPMPGRAPARIGGAPTSRAAAAPAPANGAPRTSNDIPPPPAAGQGPVVSRAGGMTSITATHWDVDQKQIVDSVTQAAPMLARVEQALSKQYGADPAQYPNDWGTKAHQVGQTLAYAVGQQPSDPTYQTIIPLVSFLRTFLTQPYLRGIRNMQYIEQIQNHMPHVSPIPDSPQLMASKIAIIKENLGGIMHELNAPNPFGGGPTAASIPPPPGAAPGAAPHRADNPY